MIRIVVQALLLGAIAASPWIFADALRSPRITVSVRRPIRPEVTIETARGVRLRDAGGVWRKLIPGEELQLPIDFEVGEDGALTVSHRGKKAEFGPSSRGTIGIARERWPVRLARGRIEASARRGRIRTAAGGGQFEGAKYRVTVGSERAAADFEDDLFAILATGPRALTGPGQIVITDGRLRETASDLDDEPEASRPAKPRALRDARRRTSPERPRRPKRRGRTPPDEPLEGPGRTEGRARTAPDEPPERLEVDWTRLGRPDGQGLEGLKQETPAPSER